MAEHLSLYLLNKTFPKIFSLTVKLVLKILWTLRTVTQSVVQRSLDIATGLRHGVEVAICSRLDNEVSIYVVTEVPDQWTICVTRESLGSRLDQPSKITVSGSRSKARRCA